MSVAAVPQAASASASPSRFIAGSLATRGLRATGLLLAARNRNARHAFPEDARTVRLWHEDRNDLARNFAASSAYAALDSSLAPVTGLLFAFTLGAAGEVWVAAEGLAAPSEVDSGACSAEAFAAALRAQRPRVVVHAWHPEAKDERPPEGAVQARLAQRDGVVTLDAHGAGVSLLRTLPATDPCERNVATAALIVDGALDVLQATAKAPIVDSLARPVPFVKQLHVSAVAGAGAEQGMFNFVPAFALGAAVRYRYLELTLDVDLGLPSQTTFTILPPEATQSGTFSAVEGSTEIAVGLAPRLGPGHLAADVVAGLSFIHASATSTGIFQQQPETAMDPFAGLRLGYALDLPRGLFLALRAEERITRPTTFAIDGAAFAPPLGQDAVTTPVWSFLALALFGYHFS